MAGHGEAGHGEARYGKGLYFFRRTIMQKLEFRIRGVSPLLHHSARLANPRDPIVKAMKKVSSKRSKTDDDHDELSRLEFMGGIYVNSEGRVIIPGECIEAALLAAAKKQKLGPKAKSGIFVSDDNLLIYKGPQTAEELFKDPEFVDIRCVRVTTSRIMRTRPIFKRWECCFTVTFDNSQLDDYQIREFVETAGSIIGLCDFRPRFGRFEIAE
jgi:hypothetical protein